MSIAYNISINVEAGSVPKGLEEALKELARMAKLLNQYAVNQVVVVHGDPEDGVFTIANQSEPIHLVTYWKEDGLWFNTEGDELNDSDMRG